ncbi:MAG: type-F conjugative transfer system secretin TraK, partial [Chlamydiia bacterium]|nr:type-F conjugative transfer system secretin TraK [Chlamydiia bacterium]
MNLKHLFFLLNFFLVSLCFAVEENAFSPANTLEMTFQENIPLQVTFSSHSHNRIAWENDRIVSVIGDERLFNVEMSPKIGQAFISILKPLPEGSATITVVSSRGFVQDIQIKSENKPATLLSIKVP